MAACSVGKDGDGTFVSLNNIASMSVHTEILL